MRKEPDDRQMSLFDERLLIRSLALTEGVIALALDTFGPRLEKILEIVFPKTLAQHRHARSRVTAKR